VKQYENKNLLPADLIFALFFGDGEIFSLHISFPFGFLKCVGLSYILADLLLFTQKSLYQNINWVYLNFKIFVKLLYFVLEKPLLIP